MLNKRLRMYSGEVRNLAIDFGPPANSDENASGKLDAGELLTGAVTVTILPVTSPVLASANAAVNTATRVINGRTAAIGEAVQLKLSGGLVGTTVFDEGSDEEEIGTLYEVTVSVATTSTPAQTLKHTEQIEFVNGGSLS